MSNLAIHVQTNAAAAARESSPSQRAAATGFEELINQQAAAGNVAPIKATDEPSDKKGVHTMNTSHGYTEMNLNEYFSNEKKTGKVKLDEIPLLLPSADNIAALSEHVSDRFKSLLSNYGIPEAPASISYNREGKMQLPADYAYADEFNAMLEENPGFENELRTLNALSSHFAELQKLAPFHAEYAQANSQAEIEAVVAKYSHLFWGNRQNSDISLAFTPNGGVQVMADGEALKLA